MLPLRLASKARALAGFAAAATVLVAPLASYAGSETALDPIPTGSTHIWSKRFGDDRSQSARHMTFDAAGNIYVLGVYSGTMDLGGGPLTSQTNDVFIAKLDADGDHIWSRTFGDGAAQIGHAIAVHDDGRVVAAGYYNGTVDFGGGPLTSNGVDVFVVQLDAAGNHLWSRSFGDAAIQFLKSVAIDALGDIVIIVDLQGTIDFGGGPLSAGPNFETDPVAAKFDAAGNHVWSRNFGDPAGGGYIYGLAIDSADNIVVTGGFGGSIDFGAGPLTALGSGDLYVAKLTPAGTEIWAHQYGDDAWQDGSDVTVDSDDNVIVSGTYGGSIDFGAGAHTSSSDSDVFVAKLHPNGDGVWSRAYGNGNFQNPPLVAVDPAGGVALAGTFDGDLDLGSGLLVHQGEADMYLARFDAGGTPLWSAAFGDAPNQVPLSIKSNAPGRFAICGWFVGTMDFGGGPLASDGTSSDIFLAVLGDPGATDVPAPRPRTVLLQNRPNPFNPTTEIGFELSHPGHVRLEVRDVRGRLVATLVDGPRAAGSNSSRWDGVDHRGRRVASGEYFYTIRASGLSETRKMMIVK